MTTPMPAEHMTAALLRSDLRAAEAELDHVDAVGDSAAVARVRVVFGPRIVRLRRALAAAERDRRPTTEVHG